MTVKLTPLEVRDLMYAKARGSRISEKQVRDLGFTPYTREAAVHNQVLTPAQAQGAGFKIPYFDLQGKKTRFYRFRFLEDTRKGFSKLTGAKSMRYTQPAGMPPEVYMPPLVDWAEYAASAAVPLLITEGELKAACASGEGLPCLGLGGVYNFQSAAENQLLIPSLKAFDWKERTVYIVFDSDASTNPQVVKAEQRLAKRLMEEGAQVFIGRIPNNTELVKTGLDDYIMLYGAQAFRDEVLNTAFPYEGAEALHEMNERVIYVGSPSCVWDFGDMKRMSVKEFKDEAYCNWSHSERVETAKGFTLKQVRTAPKWMEWKHRNEAKSLVFKPGADRIVDGRLNTWDAWGVSSPVEGDIRPWEWLLDRVFGEETEARAYFEQWAAYPLQHPGAKMAVAAALWGPEQGTGKTQVGHTLMRIYGRKHSIELKDTQLDDVHNRWAEGIQFALADDITARGDRKFMRRLMTMITQHHMQVDPKFIAPFTIEDVINYYFTSNDPDALYMDDHDRRFFIHEVTCERMTREDAAHYTAWRDSDAGIRALWHHLLALDLDGFDPQAPAPSTRSKEQMVRLGKSDLGSWVRDLKENAAVILQRAGLKGDLFNAKELMALYDPSGDKRVTLNALARELKRAGFNPPANGTSIRLPDDSMTMVYAILNGGAWRNHSWSEACRHYISNRPKTTWDIKKGKI